MLVVIAIPLTWNILKSLFGKKNLYPNMKFFPDKYFKKKLAKADHLKKGRLINFKLFLKVRSDKYCFVVL